MDQLIESRLRKANLTLPNAVKPFGAYANVSQADGLIYVSGMAGFLDGKLIKGIVGDSIDVEQAAFAARQTMLMTLACLDEAIGLGKISRCIRLTVYSRTTSDFEQHPAVANGACDVLSSVFEGQPLRARTAIGVYTLPMGIAVEIDSVFKLS